MVRNIFLHLEWRIRGSQVWQTDGQTDRQPEWTDVNSAL